MKLGFGVDALLQRARGGGALRMGLVRLSEPEWLQPGPDVAARGQAFADYPEGVELLPEGEAACRELAALLGVEGGLLEAAAARHEDMCIADRDPAPGDFRLVGAAVAWPSDWAPRDKIGLTVRELHAPIHGYEAQLAEGVDRFMATLEAGAIFGRSNWFVTPTDAMRWVAAPPERAFAHVTCRNAGETLFVRCERQTLRRLPRSGAIVFTIGVYVEPLARLSDANLARLRDAVGALIDGEGERRGAGAYADALIGYADRREEMA